MRKTVLFVLAALVLPTSVALAKPPHPAKGGKSAPKVQYVLKGSLSAYTAASSTTNGSITIDIKHANYHARALKNLPGGLTLTLTAKSKVTFRHHSTLDNGATARGVITLRAPKRISGDLATGLQTQATRIHVVVLKNLSS